MKKVPTISGLLIASITVILALAVLSPVSAHKGASGVVKKRMNVMKEMNGQLKKIYNIVEGKSAYDHQLIEKSLVYFKDHGGKKMTRLFPKGTAHKPSEADPLIWKNWPEFEKLALQLNHSSEEFRILLTGKKVDGPSTDSLKKSYLSLRRTCKNCHDLFRE